jgi:pimeloyl-ACP methyl ester carboxylesterase
MMGNIPRLELVDVRSRAFGSGQDYLFLETGDGCVEGIFRSAESSSGVIWVSGARGGVDGPSFGVFTVLSYKLGVNSLRLHYRFPGDFEACVRDVLLGVDFLRMRGVDDVAVVGHSFGGAVAIMAGALCEQVKAVVGLSSQTYGAQRVSELSPRPLLLVHGERDRNLSVECSHVIYGNAGEPKKLVTFKGCGHFLRECNQEVHDLLKDWLMEKLCVY